jgi:hypothetical protein
MYCGAPSKRTGKPCRQRAGWGTPHPGRGPCRRHLGNVPNVCKRYCREEAIEYAREHLGSEIDDDPLEAMLQGVRIASGIVAYHRRKIDLLDVVTPADVEALEAANLNRQRIAEMAIRGGVAEKLVDITQRMAEQLALAAEEMLAALVKAGVSLTNEQRTIAAQAYAAAVRKLEGQPIEAEAKQLAA